MDNFIMEIVKNTKKSGVYTNFEENIEEKIEKKMKKNLVIKIPRNDIKFKLNFDDVYISPKICHSVNVYTKN